MVLMKTFLLHFVINIGYGITKFVSQILVRDKSLHEP